MFVFDFAQLRHDILGRLPVQALRQLRKVRIGQRLRLKAHGPKAMRLGQAAGLRKQPMFMQHHFGIGYFLLHLFRKA